MKLTTEGKRGVPRRIPGQYPRGSNVRTRRPVIRGTRPGLSRARRRRRPRPSASGIWKGRFSSRDELPKVPKDFFCFFAKQPNNRVGSENTRVCVAFTLQVCRDLMPAYDWRRSDWTTSNKIQARTVLGARAITTDAEGYRPPPVNARARTLPLEPHGATRPFASTRDDTHAPPRTRVPACRDVNFPIGNPRCPLRALTASRA